MDCEDILQDVIKMDDDGPRETDEDMYPEIICTFCENSISPMYQRFEYVTETIIRCEPCYYQEQELIKQFENITFE